MAPKVVEKRPGAATPPQQEAEVVVPVPNQAPPQVPAAQPQVPAVLPAALVLPKDPFH
jgi:hypothetical protein